MKKIKNYACTIVLSMLMVMMFSITVCAYEINPESLKNCYKITAEADFTIDEEGYITAYLGDSDVVVIPAEIGGKAVKGLDKTFKDNEKVVKVIIPDSIEEFKDETFCGSKVGNISVYETTPIDVNTIDEHFDFSKCIYAPEKGENVLYAVTDYGAFVIPSKLNKIGNKVFYKCPINKFFVMDDNTFFTDSDDAVMKINEEVILCGVSLLSFDKKDLIKVATNYGSSSGTVECYAITEGVDCIKPYALTGVDYKLIKIPASVTTICDYAFYECISPDKIEFVEESKCTTIGKWAFAYDTNTNITLPKSVKDVYSYAFAYITNRTPDISKSSIETLHPYLFYQCNNLHQITMPESLKVIEGYAFDGCDNLNNIYFLGDTLEKLGTGAFKGCPNLHEIEIPEGITAIENDTFDGCWNLNKIILPDTLKKIGDNAFKDCKNIHEMVIPKSVVYISNSSFKGADTTAIDTSKNKYAQTTIPGVLPKKGNSFVSGKLVYNVTSIKQKSGTVTLAGLSGNTKKTSLKKLNIGATITYQGYKFKITAIANKAFYNCKKLKSVTIGSNITKIGKSAFYKDKLLKKITIKSKKLKKINKNAFKNINKKATVKVPKGKKGKYRKLLKKAGIAKTVRIK